MVCRGACPADDKSIAQTAETVGKSAEVQKSLKGFLKKFSTQAHVREDVREKKSTETKHERNRQGEALGRSARETAEEKRWDEARKKPPGGSAGTERKRNRQRESAGTKRERNRQGKALGRSERETAKGKHWDDARKPPRESAGAKLRRSESQSAEPPSAAIGKRKADRRAEEQEPKQKGNALREMGREERTAGRLRKKQDGRG